MVENTVKPRVRSSSISRTIGITERIASDAATYSALAVESAISVVSFDCL